jgi:DNA-binding NtrC family response regulator
MTEEIQALLVLSSEVPVPALIEALEIQYVQIDRVQTCKEAAWRLASSDPPHLVFTNPELVDGSWTDVMDLAALAVLPVGVIVVSPSADVRLYVDIIERRAFDLITHSFTVQELSPIVRSAVDYTVSRRKGWARLPMGKAKIPLPSSATIVKEI